MFVPATQNCITIRKFGHYTNLFGQLLQFYLKINGGYIEKLLTIKNTDSFWFSLSQNRLSAVLLALHSYEYFIVSTTMLYYQYNTFGWYRSITFVPVVQVYSIFQFCDIQHDLEILIDGCLLFFTLMWLFVCNIFNAT